MLETKRNQSIDLIKFVMSFFVVAIHAQLFMTSNKTLYNIIPMGIMRIAVPLFFVISGYFYYQRIQMQKDTKQYLSHLMKIFIIFECIEVVIYLPFIIKEYGIALLAWKAISVGLSGAYWYLTSLVISLLILTPLWKKKRILPMFIIGMILYLFVFTIDSYATFFDGTMIQKIAFVHQDIWTWPQAGLCSSLFYLSIGALIYEYKPKLKVNIMMVIISLLVLMIEAYYLQNNKALDGNCYVSLMICVPICFLYLLQHPSLPFQTHLLGKMSLYIYMTHTIILTILRQFIYQKDVLFVLASLISLLISYIIVRRSS